MSQPAPDLQGRLQAALRTALQARDTAAVSALRSARAAISNAEAVAPPPRSGTPGGNRHIAGTVGGLGAGEAPRRRLTEQDASDIVRAEITDRQHAAELYERSGHADRADHLRREALVLAAVMSAGPAAPQPPAAHDSDLAAPPRTDVSSAG